MTETVQLQWQAGLKINAGDGGSQGGFPELCSTPFFYTARAGDKLRLLDAQYKFNVATYTPKIREEWIYTYCYAPDGCWAVYRNDLRGDTYRQDDYIFTESVYFRVCLRKADRSGFDGTENCDAIISFENTPATPTYNEDKSWLTDEIARVSAKVNALRADGDLIFAILADTHYTVNGTWADTACSIQGIQERVGLDGIIHLGDWTDGMMPQAVTRAYVNEMKADLRACGVPLWAALGNHDSNYFRGNLEPFTDGEQARLYLDRADMRYRVNLRNGICLLFLDSFDRAETLKYGYSTACAAWLERELASIPDDGQAVICSHLPPTARLQYWAKELRGEADIMRVLHRHKTKILAYLNGHNHGDCLDNAEGFPILSIANAKCEAFLTHKTEGFVTPPRKLNTASQGAWDIMLVNKSTQTVQFLRFGAGKDRIIENGRVDWA